MFAKFEMRLINAVNVILLDIVSHRICPDTYQAVDGCAFLQIVLILFPAFCKNLLISWY